MAKRMLIDAVHSEETRVVILDDNQIYDFDFVTSSKKQLKGNIYLAKITRVEPSLQAAFVEYGGGKQGFLPFSEIHTDYYQIPVSDRQRLMEESEREVEVDDTRETVEQPQGQEQQFTEEQSDLAFDQEANDISTELPPAIPAGADDMLPEQAPAAEDESRPAYLMQSAEEIVTSSEEIDLPEQMDSGNAPEDFNEAGNTEQSTIGATSSESDKNEEVETLPNEEEEVQQRRPKRNAFLKRYKIQEVIRRGQIVLVQVIKEERGNKGVSLTTYLSLAGRYCVLMPNSPKDGGISRKIASAEDRKRLKAISTEMRLAQGMSVIIRTAGMERTRGEIKRDYDYLVKLWNQIREDTLKSTAPALIYEESDIIKRAIRDQYNNDIDDVIIEGDAGYRAARDFMKILLPSHTPKIKQHQESTPLFYAYNVEDQLLSMHDPVCKLRSGGYIVMNPTEALISIDVNSGRATTERNIEETATKTNLEAAVEIARQLRLRDLAGLIVIDFIDMLESRNRRAVEKALKDALKADRAKIQLGRISPFGLLEMSRQRLRPSISESNMVQCAHCTGRGYIRSNDSMSIQIIRAIEKEASTGTWSGLRLIAPQALALHLLNSKRDALRALEQRHNVSLQILINNDLPDSEFNLEKMRRSQTDRGSERSERNERSERSERNDNDRGRGRDRGRDRDRDRDRDRNRHQEHAAPAVEPASVDDVSGDNITEISDPQRDDTYSPDGRRGRRRGRRGGRNRDRNDRPQQPSDNVIPMTAAEPAAAEEIDSNAPEAGNQPGDDNRRERRQRGGRGRRRWRDRDDRSPRRDDEQNKSEKTWNTAEAASASVNVLPSFAAENPVKSSPPPLPTKEAKAVNAAPSTPRDPNAPTKKGWWQKMIQLDE
jgi:ribonuclease E